MKAGTFGARVRFFRRGLFLNLREQTPTSEIPGFNETLTALLPGLAEHTCSRGYPGGFLERLREGTYLGHVVEHVALELQSAAGFPVSYGKTLGGNVPGTWDLVISCRTAELGATALETAVDWLRRCWGVSPLKLRRRSNA